MDQQFLHKPATTLSEQIDILKRRELIIKDEQYAISILERVGYYRLSAYMLSLKTNDVFHPGITFEHLYKLYEFDKKLRNLMLEHLESIEVSFRSLISYIIAHNYGPLGYKDHSNFQNIEYHKNFMQTLDTSIQKQKELFIEHHRKKYGGHIPIWAASEVISFSALSKLYSNMKIQDQKEIARKYNVHYKFVKNWLNVLSYIRNLCAHFARLYNKALSRKVKLDMRIFDESMTNTLFGAIYAMLSLSHYDNRIIFLNDIYKIIDEYEDFIELNRIGFPREWKNILDRLFVNVQN